MGRRNEGDCLRELQDYFDQRAKIAGDNPPLWEHASEMCQAMLQDMGGTDAGPLTSLYTRIIGEMVISVNKASMAAAIAKESQARRDKQVEEFVEEKKSLDAKVIELQRQVKQANADEHNALSVVDRLKGELKSAKESLQVSCDANSRLERKLAEIMSAARLTEGELEALAFVNKERGMFGESVHRLADFVGRARSVLEPHIIDAMPAETLLTEQPAAPGPSQRLKAVEQELALVWQVVNAMADEKVGRVSKLASTAILTRDLARKERGG